MDAAQRYTHGHHESVLRSHRWRTARNSAGHLLPHLRAGLTVLEVGAGPGTITADLAGLVAPGEVIVTEVTGAALDLARAELTRRDVTNVTYDVQDVHALTLPDDSVDVVHAHQVLQHVADPVTALREMRRVCRPGGVVAVRDSDYSGFVWYPRLPELDEWMRLYQEAARANGGEPDAGRHLLAWARAAGFADITVDTSTWCFATPEDRAYWGGMWADRIVSSDLADQLQAGGRATREDLEGIAAAWRTWSRAADALMSLLHTDLIARP